MADTHSTDETSEPKDVADNKTGLEELLEDVFGLNIRTFKTLKTLFVRPRDYFLSARTQSWSDGTYTPSPRLWLALITITVVTRFIWGAEDGALNAMMGDAVRSGFEQGAGDNLDKLPDIDWDALIQRLFDITLLIQPFIFMAVMMLLAIVLRFWGEALPYVVRLRYIFAIIVPATLINLLITLGLIFVPPGSFMIVGLSQLIIMIFLYAWTAYWGAFVAEPPDSAIPKSIMIALIIFVCVMLANFIAQIIATAWVIVPELRDAIDIAKANAEASP